MIDVEVTLMKPYIMILNETLSSIVLGRETTHCQSSMHTSKQYDISI